MRAIEILRREHALLLRVLTSLEALARDTVRSGELDGKAAGQILGFLERFADGRHQVKEEAHLFRVALDRAPRESRTAIQRMLEGHQAECELLDDLRQHLDLARSGDSWSIDLFSTRAREYVALQREHIRIEDEQLFPLIEQLLGAGDDEEIVAGFEETDRLYGPDVDLAADHFATQLCTE
jgi:branched-chain amino acid transport system ATP-binding protein